MYYVYKLVKSFDRFTKLSNAKSFLRKRADSPKHLRDFLGAINNLPLAWDDTVEGPDWVFNEHHEFLAQGVRVIRHKEVIEHETCEAGQCHKRSLMIKAANPDYKLFLGFAVVDGCQVGRDWTVHSWCMDGDTIIEGTPLSRNIYYGIEIPNLDTAMRVYARSNPIELRALQCMLKEGTLKGF